MPTEITKCRMCGSTQLEPLLSLGEQALTGVFPRRPDERLTRGSLDLVRCDGPGACGLVQLRHSFESSEMYGENYGYRSGLNRSMVEHLGSIVTKLLKYVQPGKGDVVLDIGSNDGTLLSFYPAGQATLLGMDPTSAKFRKFYRPDIKLVVDFFSSENFRSAVGPAKVRIVTSIAMFYDLEDPLSFAKQVAEILADDGIWHFEQSYLPAMLSQCAYDTICHEHLEYYAFHQIQWLVERAGLKVLQVEQNDVNGGSFAITVAKANSPHQPDEENVRRFAEQERKLGLDGPAPYEAFARQVEAHRQSLRKLLQQLKDEGKKVLGYGASTKGNVILQYCGIDQQLLPAIAEVNDYKFGRYTPGTGVPIISEADAHARKPDYLLVLPWHFRDNLLGREEAFLRSGGKMIFPLPHIEIIGK